MFRAFRLPSTALVFGSNRVHQDKLKGLYEFGPYRTAPVSGEMKLGFLFPTEYRDSANDLFRAMKSGLGYFRGVESTFRLPFNRDSVFPITGFSLPNSKDHSETARRYSDAVLGSSVKSGKPDLIFVLHPQTARWETDTAYYQSKAQLLQQGILSQHVTLEILQDHSRFEWSIANIALAVFAKLGGVPWIVQGEGSDKDLIIGLGRADLFSPKQRKGKRCLGFTACFSARGLFKFVSLADIAETREEYHRLLDKIVTSSVQRALNTQGAISSLTLHVPKEMGYEEGQIVRAAVKRLSGDAMPLISVVKVSDEEQLFLCDESVADRAVPRGTIVQTGDTEFLLYTEGREERQSWKNRVPSALRVKPQFGLTAQPQVLDALRRINDLSQVNWRGFNSRSRPISINYGDKITQILSRIPPALAQNLYSDKSKHVLEERMWFI